MSVLWTLVEFRGFPNWPTPDSLSKPPWGRVLGTQHFMGLWAEITGWWGQKLSSPVPGPLQDLLSFPQRLKSKNLNLQRRLPT